MKSKANPNLSRLVSMGLSIFLLSGSAYSQDLPLISPATALPISDPTADPAATCGTAAFLDRWLDQNAEYLSPTGQTKTNDAGLQFLDHLFTCNQRIETLNYRVPDVLSIYHHERSKGLQRVYELLLKRQGLEKLLDLTYTLSILLEDSSLLKGRWVNPQLFPGFSKKIALYQDQYDRLSRTPGALQQAQSELYHLMAMTAMALKSYEFANYSLLEKRKKAIETHASQEQTLALAALDQELVDVEASKNRILHSNPIYALLNLHAHGPDPDLLKDGRPEHAVFGNFEIQPIYREISKSIEKNLIQNPGAEIHAMPRIRRQVQVLIAPWLNLLKGLVRSQKIETLLTESSVLMAHTQLRKEVIEILADDTLQVELEGISPSIYPDLISEADVLFTRGTALKEFFIMVTKALPLVRKNLGTVVVSISSVIVEWTEKEALRNRISFGHLLGWNSYSDIRHIHSSSQSRSSSNIYAALDLGLLAVAQVMQIFRPIAVVDDLIILESEAQKAGIFARYLSTAKKINAGFNQWKSSPIQTTVQTFKTRIKDLKGFLKNPVSPEQKQQRLNSIANSATTLMAWSWLNSAGKDQSVEEMLATKQYWQGVMLSGSLDLILGYLAVAPNFAGLRVLFVSGVTASILSHGLTDREISTQRMSMDGVYISTVSFLKGIGFSSVADAIIRFSRSKVGPALSSWKLDFPIRLFLNGINNGIGEWMYVETLTPLERSTLEEIFSSHSDMLQSREIPKESIETKLQDYIDYIEKSASPTPSQFYGRPSFPAHTLGRP